MESLSERLNKIYQEYDERLELSRSMRKLNLTKDINEYLLTEIIGDIKNTEQDIILDKYNNE